MERRFIIVLLFIYVCLTVQAQIAKWAVSPRYDYIQLIGELRLYKGTVNDTTFIWNLSGDMLCATPYYVGPFTDGYAPVSENNRIKGFIDPKGKFHEVDHNGIIDSEYPFFCDGQLLIKDGEYYDYLDTDGSIHNGHYVSATPFHNGFSAICKYENESKKKNLSFALFAKDRSVVNFYQDDKIVKNNDISFVSPPNDDGISVVVIKKEVYLYNVISHAMDRLSSDNSINKKTFQNISALPILIDKKEDGSSQIYTNSGVLTFTKRGLLSKIDFQETGYHHEYKEASDLPVIVRHELIASEAPSGMLFGIDWQKSEDLTIKILPPQFSEVSGLIADNAIVCLNNKYGVVSLDRSSSFDLSLNNGIDIGFVHNKYLSNILVNLPTYISWNNVTLSFNKGEGIEIIPSSRQGSDTREGNFLRYDCTIHIPQDITENRVSKKYHCIVSYEGISSFPIDLPVNVWYEQKYDLEVESPRLDNDTIIFDIKVNRIGSTETDNVYWTELKYTSPYPMSSEVKKNNSSSYQVKVYDVVDGDYQFILVLNEDGCPPIKFPFSMVYKKPASARVAGKIEIHKQ